MSYMPCHDDDILDIQAQIYQLTCDVEDLAEKIKEIFEALESMKD